MAWMCFEIAINLLQAIMMVWFVRRKLHLVHPEMRYAALTVAGVTVLLTLYLFVDMSVSDIVVYLLPLAYALWAADDPWYMKVFWVGLLTAAFNGVIQMMTSLLLMLPRVSWEIIMQETPLRLFYVISTNLVLFIVLYLLSRKHQAQSGLSAGAMAVFVLLEMVNLTVGEIGYTIRLNDNQADTLYIMLSVCSFLAACLSLALYQVMSALAVKQRASEAETERLRLTQHHAGEMKEMYTYMVAQQHDMQKQLDVLRRMMEAGYQQEGQAFLQQLSPPKENSLQFVTGSIAVDALLTGKKLTMDKAGIRFVFQPYPLHELPLPESDFCVILSNLLDNAVEAIGRMEPSEEIRTIRLTLARSWNIFFITCQNPADQGTLRRHGDTFITSKNDGLRHGHGLRNIRQIVESRQGELICRYEQGVFTAQVTLKLEQQA